MWLVERYLIAPRHSILNCIKTRRRPHYTHASKALITQHDTHTRARCGINVRQPVSCYLLWSKKQTSLSNLELISHLKSKHCSCMLKRNYIENAVNPTEKITSKHWIRSTVWSLYFLTPKMSVTNPYSGRNLRDLKQTITWVYLKRREKSGAIKSVQLPCGKKLRSGMCAVDLTGEAAGTT